MSLPPMIIEPPVGLSNAPSRESKVDLPLPLLPIIEANWPSGTLKLISSTAVTFVSPDWNVLLRPFTSIIVLLRPHYFIWPYFGNHPAGKRTADDRNEQSRSQAVE